MTTRAWMAAAASVALLGGACSNQDGAAALQAAADAYTSPIGWVRHPPASNAMAGFPYVHADGLCSRDECLTGSIRHEEVDAAELDAAALDAIAASLAALPGAGAVTLPVACVPTNLDDNPCAWSVEFGDGLRALAGLATSTFGPEPNEKARLNVRFGHAP